MAGYLIEFRFHGKAKYEIKNLIHDVNRRFRLGIRRAIPHITLAGPLQCSDEKRLIGDFNRLCTNSPLMGFEIEGFGTFENSKVVFVDIKPSEELKKFRWDLANKIKSYCKLRPFDYEGEFAFHSTIAMKLPDDKFSRVKNYISKCEKLHFKHVMVRATLLKGGIILREYDFMLRRPLVRRFAKDKKVYSQTIELLKAHFENKVNTNEFMGERIKQPAPSFMNKIKTFFRKPKVFITSDLHLDHTNIIKYCQRPFLSTEEMNNTLINNWNSVISKKDIVYFLGDMSFGRGSKPTDYWLDKLNGKVIFIKGNHDRSDKIEFHDNYILEYKGHKFYLVHEPEKVPNDWKDWAICGHHHNNKPEEYPFINKAKKRINVSVELTKYLPVELDDILEKIDN